MIDFDSNWASLSLTVIVPLQILAVDLLLSADNALVIALASR
jgi:predicted tellurium resistance membrane protein TerC